MACNYTRQTKRGVWECEQEDCNGIEHFAEFYPYMKPNASEDLTLFLVAATLGLTLGFLLFHYFGLGS